MSQIHSSAIIEDGAIIGKDVSIGAYCIIESGVSIDDGTTIANHACIYGNTTIGKNNKIFSHAVLGSIPQDLKFDGEEVELIIGDNNSIREFTLINPGTKGGGSKTIIGNNNLLMGHVHLGHDVIVGDNVVIANTCAIAGHVEIDNNAVIGGMSGIHQFCKIGTHVMIGAGSLVTQDIPPYTLAEGSHAVVRTLNINGLRRRFNKEIIGELKKAFKLVFDSNDSIQESAKILFENSDNEHIKIFAQFITNTKRGIPYKRKHNG